jgi:hypothetical protein
MKKPIGLQNQQMTPIAEADRPIVERLDITGA